MANRKIRQEINIINQEFVNPTGDANLDGGLIAIDQDNYNGMDQYGYFEIICKNTHGSIGYTLQCLLRDSGDTTKVTITIYGNETDYIRKRGFILSGLTNDTYHIYLNNSVTNWEDHGYIKSAKLIILQDAAEITDTQTQIEIGQYGTIIPAAESTWYQIPEPKYWKYEASKWDATTKTVKIGLTFGCEDDMESYNFGLYDVTDADYAGGNLQDLITGVSTEAATYYESADIFSYLEDGHVYCLAYEGDDDKDDMYFYNAKVIVTSFFFVNADRTSAVASRDGFYAGLYQSFEVEQDASLVSVSFLLSKSGSPTGNLTAKLYAHSGTFGTTSVPTGTAIASSSSLDASTISASYEWVTFDISYDLLASTQYYCIGIEFDGGTEGNTINVGYAEAVCDGNASYTDDPSGSPPTFSNFAPNDLSIRISTSITKLQTEYLLINEAQTDTGSQEYQTLYDANEWDDGGGNPPTLYHEHSADSASSNTKLEDSGGDISNSSITGTGLQRSSAITLDDDEEIDANIVTA